MLNIKFWKLILAITCIINLASMEVVQITQANFLEHLGFQSDLLLESDDYFAQNPTQLSRPIMIFFQHSRSKNSSTAFKTFKKVLSQIGPNNDIKTCIALCDSKSKTLCRKYSIITYPTLIRIDKRVNICTFQGQFTEEKLFHFLKNDANVLNSYCSYEDTLLGENSFVKIWQLLPELISRGQYFQYFTQTIFIIFFIVTFCVGITVGIIAWKLIPDPYQSRRKTVTSTAFADEEDDQLEN